MNWNQFLNKYTTIEVLFPSLHRISGLLLYQPPTLGIIPYLYLRQLRRTRSSTDEHRDTTPPGQVHDPVVQFLDNTNKFTRLKRRDIRKIATGHMSYDESSSQRQMKGYYHEEDTILMKYEKSTERS